MDLGAMLYLIRRWWLVLLVATVGGGIVGHTLASGKEPVYESEVRLLVGPINADSATLRASGQLAQTYAELATGNRLREETVAAVAPSLDPEAVVVRASANEVTRLLTVRVRAATADGAVAVVGEVAARLVALGEQPVTVAPEQLPPDQPVPPPAARPEGRMQVVEPPGATDGPVSPQVGLSTLFAALAGLAAAAGPVLLVEYAARRVRRPEDLPDDPRIALLGVLGRRRPGRRRRPHANRLVVESLSQSATAESFRFVATEIEATVRHRRDVHTLLVAGTAPADGSGNVAANLAAALVHTGREVVLVDDDTHGREVTALPAPAGERARLDLRRGPGLTVLPCRDVAAALGHDVAAARRWLADLLVAADVVIVHAPPPSGSPSTLLWAAATDATVLVVRAEVARREGVTESLDSLDRVQAEVIGVLFDARRAGHYPVLGALSRRVRRGARRVAARLGDDDRAGAAAPAEPVAHDQRLPFGDEVGSNPPEPTARPRLAAVPDEGEEPGAPDAGRVGS